MACYLCQSEYRKQHAWVGGLLVRVVFLCWWCASVGDMPAWVMWWCSNVGKVGGVLTWVAWVVVLQEIPGWFIRKYRGWRIISQTLS